MGIKTLERLLKKLLTSRAIVLSDDSIKATRRAEQGQPLVVIDGEGLAFFLMKNNLIDDFAVSKNAALADAVVAFVSELIKVGYRVTIIFGGMSEAIKDNTCRQRAGEKEEFRKEQFAVLTARSGALNGNADALRNFRHEQKSNYCWSTPFMIRQTFVHALAGIVKKHQVQILNADGENDQVRAAV